MTLDEHLKRIGYLLYRYVSKRGRKENKWRRTFKASTKAYQQELKNIRDIKSGILQFPFANKGKGKGIILCGGGDRLFGTGLAVIKALREYGNQLPIQWFYADEEEMTHEAIKLLETLGAECVNLDLYPELKDVKKRGYQIKPIAIACSKFEEILFLDCDNMPLRDPAYLFELDEYKETGAVFWKDLWRYHCGHIFTGPDQRKHVHELFGIQEPEIGEHELESGQIMIDKSRHWRGVQLFLYMNLNWQLYYTLLYGDKDTYAIALKSCEEGLHIVKTPPAVIGVVDTAKNFSGYGMVQHDPKGNHCFIHMTMTDLYVKKISWNAFINSLDSDVYYDWGSETIKFKKKDVRIYPVTEELAAWQDNAHALWKRFLNEDSKAMESFGK